MHKIQSSKFKNRNKYFIFQFLNNLLIFNIHNFFNNNRNKIYFFFFVIIIMHNYNKNAFFPKKAKYLNGYI